MNTILFFLGGATLALVVLAKIPGLEHLVKPIIDLAFTGLKVFLESAIAWAVWLFKLVWEAHWGLIQHLLLPAETLDPSAVMRKDSNS